MSFGEMLHEALYAAFDFTELSAWFIWGPIVLAAAVRGFSEPLP